jgi:hypothetical protein
MTAFVFFIFKSAGEGFKSLQKKTPKNTDSHPPVLLNCFKFCAPVVFVWFWLLFSCLRRRGRRDKRGSDITFCFPKHSFLSFYYHKMDLLYSFIISKILVYIFNFFLTNPWNSIEKGCHTNCVTFLAYIFRWTFFLERDISMIFCGHRHIIITHCLTLA